MSVESSEPPVLPDPRNYLKPGPYLAEWCAAQPERKVNDKLRELARMAGCSVSQIHHIIHKDRPLNLTQARNLVTGLRLEEPAAQHLLGLFEQFHLPAPKARGRRESLIRTVAAFQGAPGGASGSLVAAEQPEEAVIAALAPALAALEDDLPRGVALTRAIVSPVSAEQLQRARTTPSGCTRLAPHLLAVPDPDVPGATWIHQGLLTLAHDALVRLPGTERDSRVIVATTDAIGAQAIDAARDQLIARVIRLAQDVALRVPVRALALNVQHHVVAGPFPRGLSTGELRRVKPELDLPLLEQGAEPAAPARPHPTGLVTFPSWLRIWRRWAATHGQPTSDSYLAQETELSRATIHDLAAGTLRFSSEHVYRFVRVFGLSNDKAGQAALEAMAVVATPDHARHRARIIHALRSSALAQGIRNHDTDAFLVQSQWYAQAIHLLPELGEVPRFGAWLCRALSGAISPETALDAMRALGALGLLRQDAQGRVVQRHPLIQMDPTLSAIALHELNHGVLNHHQAELDRASPHLSVGAWYVGLPLNALEPFQGLLDAWWAEVKGCNADAEARRDAGGRLDRIIIVSRQCFPILRRDPRPRTGPRNTLSTEGLR